MLAVGVILFSSSPHNGRIHLLKPVDPMQW